MSLQIPISPTIPGTTDLKTITADLIKVNTLIADVITGDGSVPIGGTTNQVLAKIDNTDYNIEWTSTVIPSGGNANDVLSKNTGTNYDISWTEPHYIPSGGLANYVLAKITGTNYDVDWVNVGTVSQGLPTGGLTGSFLYKLSGTDFDTEWTSTPPVNIIVNSYNGLSLTQSITIPDIGANFNETTVTITGSANMSPSTLYRENINFTLQPSFNYWDIVDTNRYLGLNASPTPTSYNNITLDNGTIFVDPLATVNSITDINHTIQIQGSVNGGSGINGMNILKTISGTLGNGINITGYGYYPTISVGATIGTNVNLIGYQANCQLDTIGINNYSGMNIYSNGISPDYFNGFTASCNSTGNMLNFQGLNINSTNNTSIENFTGINIYSNSNVTNNFNGLYLNPTFSSIKSAYGLFIDTSNITPFVGSPSTLILQDLTFTTQTNIGPNSGIFVEYINSPSASPPAPDIAVGGTTIQLTFSTGTSTANDIKTVIDGFFAASSLVIVTVSGTGSNPQTSPVAPTELIGGENDGFVRGAFINGDVEIQGDLSFTGGLTIGQLTSFYSQPLVSSVSPGQPTSLDTLITGFTATGAITQADTLGINTACLMQFDTGSTVTTTFLGINALGLPAVLDMQAGSTVDRICGAVFALSLSGTSTGGIVDNVYLCRAIAIPNGVTTVNKLTGYYFQLLGPIATKQWGIYMEPECDNFIQGSLNIGGTPGTDDTVSSANIGLEITDKHISTKQTTAPTISSGSLTNATDVAGIVAFTSTGASGIQTVITFDKSYGVAPIIQLCPNNANAATNSIGYYVTSTVTDFTILAAANAASVSYSYFYTVIQSN